MRGVGPDGLPKETFPCSECGQKYSRLEYLRRHQRKHNAEKPFGCNLCTKSFARSDVLLRHKRRCHPEEFQESEATAAANVLISASHGGPSSRNSSSGRKRVASDANSEEDPQSRPSQRRRQGSYTALDYNVDPSLREAYGTTLQDAVSENAAFGKVYEHHEGDFGGVLDGARAPGASVHYAFDPSLTNAGAYDSHASNMVDANDQRDMSHDLYGFPLNTFGDSTSSHTGRLEDGSASLIEGSRHSISSVSAGSSAGPACTRDTALPAGDHQGIEHAAALLSMAYAMHKEHTPASNDISPMDGRDLQTFKQEERVKSNLLQNSQWPASDGRNPGTRILPHHKSNDLATEMSVLNPATSSRYALPTQQLTQALYASPEMQSIINSGLLSSNDQQALIGSNPFGIHDWNRMTSPLAMPDSANFDFTSYFPDIDAQDWQNLLAEPDGWSHLPGSAVSQMSPFREVPMIRMQAQEKMRRFGPELDRSDPFYVPYERYRACYSLQHWGLPSMQTLKRIARQTVSTLLMHVPLVHMPTFNLNDMTPAIGFPLLVIGSPRHSSLAGDRTRRILGQEMATHIRAIDAEEWIQGTGVIAPDTAPAHIELLEDQPTDEEKDFESRKALVSEEKRTMILTTIQRYKGLADATELEFMTNLIQSLLLFASPQMFSPDAHQRTLGYKQLEVVISSARKVGLFDQRQPHAALYTNLKPLNQHPHKRWKSWVSCESRRRTVWMSYLFDTLNTIETGSAANISIQDVCSIPLPAPDTLWQAPTAEGWSATLQGYQPTTLFAAMQEHFSGQPSGFSPPGFEGASHMTSLLLRNDFGMFARLIMVITLLRVVVKLGQGQPEARDLLQSWGLNLTSVVPGKMMVAMVKAYANALQKWRQGWDFDSLCATATPPCRLTTTSLNPAGGSTMRQGSLGSSTCCSTQSVQTPTDLDDGETIFSARPKGKLMFYEEALPFYWLCQTIYGTLAGDATIITDPDMSFGAIGRDRLQGISLRSMLQSARVFTRMGEGVSPEYSMSSDS